MNSPEGIDPVAATPVRESKIISIPEGLDQERVDAALARMLGLSRSVIVSLIENKEILCRGKPVTKSDKVATADVLEILMPPAKSAPQLTPTPVEGLEVIYNDESIIVINKPAGSQPTRVLAGRGRQSLAQ
jgi:23S rRNA pseudouridine1911/1915/1917 synthase